LRKKEKKKKLKIKYLRTEREKFRKKKFSLLNKVLLFKTKPYLRIVRVKKESKAQRLKKIRLENFAKTKFFKYHFQHFSTFIDPRRKNVLTFSLKKLTYFNMVRLAQEKAERVEYLKTYRPDGFFVYEKYMERMRPIQASGITLPSYCNSKKEYDDYHDAFTAKSKEEARKRAERNNAVKQHYLNLEKRGYFHDSRTWRPQDSVTY